MQTLLNKIFRDETVVLDGNDFVNCTFINCLLVFAGGHFEWNNPKFEGNCRWQIAGDALETTRFISLVTMMTPGGVVLPPTSGQLAQVANSI